MNISKAGSEDLKEILDLQYLAYQSEAALFNNKDIPPLKETLEELTEEYNNGLILKMTEGDKIIGSVRAYEKRRTAYIGKLFVHPDYRNRGYGSMLLRAIEKYFFECRLELFTSTKSVDNIRLYESLGYRRFKEEKIDDELTFVYLAKD
ncbi:MAG: GNAT family N-acetyltransferase [Clostridiales bacterium]|nr:GNAT family N-acetyltransferase [Clostridiales bacterium]